MDDGIHIVDSGIVAVISSTSGTGSTAVTTTAEATLADSATATTTTTTTATETSQQAPMDHRRLPYRPTHPYTLRFPPSSGGESVIRGGVADLAADSWRPHLSTTTSFPIRPTSVTLEIEGATVKDDLLRKRTLSLLPIVVVLRFRTITLLHGGGCDRLDPNPSVQCHPPP